MASRRLVSSARGGRQPSLYAGGVAFLLLVTALAVRKLGLAGLAAPAALLALPLLLRRPAVMISLTVGLAVLCEGQTFGFLSFTSHLYDEIYKGLTPLDVLVALSLLAIGIDLIGRRRKLVVPRPLVPALILLALAMVAGAVTGRAAGASLRGVLLGENVLVYLLLLPLAIASLEIEERRLPSVLGWITALAALKAVLGLIEIAGHYGASIEGTATLTYYEPTANWLIMITLLAIFAAAIRRVKLPLWVWWAVPLLAACLVLSYRRSFWIAAVVGLLLVALLGSSVSGRRVLLPTAGLVAVAIWLVGSVNFQSQLPVIKRIESLNPTSLSTNVEDRYRIDERANVFGEIMQHPITGLGMTIPWEATVQPLSVEHENGRQYVHFAALWYWLKLGILGVFAYLAMIAGAAVLAWRAWRRSQQPLFSAFGLATLCGLAGLLAIETTASFTGVDPRFTVMLSAQLGLLALVSSVRPAQHRAALAQGLEESSDSTVLV